MTQTKKRSSIDLEIIRQLAAVLSEAGLSEIEYASGDCRVRVAKILDPGGASGGRDPERDGDRIDFADREGRAVAKRSRCIRRSSWPVDLADGGRRLHVVRTDGAAVRQDRRQVAAGDTVLLIEAMKVFNPIKAHRAGTIERIFVTSGMPVEYGEPLLLIA